MMSRAIIKTLTFNNGIECPAFGLGTWRATGEDVYEAVKYAIKIGYRHIDTAQYYHNEADVGRAVSDSIRDLNIERKDLFIVTKLAGPCNRPSLVVPALKQSLSKLGMDYVDLYLIHHPVPRMPLGDDVVSCDTKMDENGDRLFEDHINPHDTWKAMEECVDLGLAKSIGVSNFNSCQVQDILDNCRIKPVTNQVECNPLLPQTKLREFCNGHGIFLTSFRALGGQVRKPNDPNILENDVVKRLAEKQGKTPSQILLKWQLQMNNIILVKSIQPQRIEANKMIFDFTLSEEDMAELASLECGHRYCPFLELMPSKHYPFHIEF